MPEPFCDYHVSPDQASRPLAAVLRQVRSGESWSCVRRLIRNRHVQINGSLCVDEGRKLAIGEVVRVWQEPRPTAPRSDDVRICYLDAHLVVVEKPAGLNTLRHPAERDLPAQRKRLQPSLEELVRQILGKKARPHRRGTSGRRRPLPKLRPVHRLDRETSGLLVFARTVEAERRLVQMFRQHDLERVYLALAHGRVPAATFTSSLVRDRGDGLRGSTRLPGVGKHAVTHVRPLEDLGDYTLVECRLETGRTHQIRIHLAEAGHPVCGDKVYLRPLQGPSREDRSGAPRQALHAAVLGVAHPISGQPLRFEMPLPADLAGLLDRLRSAKAGG